MPENEIFDHDGYMKSCVPQESELPVEDRVRLIACGDVGPVRNLERVVIKQGPSHILGDFMDRLKAADVVFANLECTFSLRGKPLNRVPVFRIAPEAFSIIPAAGINLVSLANNHMFDYGPDAFRDTLTLLKQHHIAYAGCGLTSKDAEEPCILKTNGMKIAFLAYRQKESPWFDHHGVYTAEIEPEKYYSESGRSDRRLTGC